MRPEMRVRLSCQRYMDRKMVLLGKAAIARSRTSRNRDAGVECREVWI